MQAATTIPTHGFYVRKSSQGGHSYHERVHHEVGGIIFYGLRSLSSGDAAIGMECMAQVLRFRLAQTGSAKAVPSATDSANSKEKNVPKY